MPAPVAIIAGAGCFPFAVAHQAKCQGRSVVAVGIKGWVDPALANEVDAYAELPIGQLSALIMWLKARGAAEVLMAGKVTKEVLLNRSSFDAEMLGILMRATDLSVSSVLGAIGVRLAQDGMTLLDSSTFLHANLCPVGPLTRRRPTASETKDIELGLRAARALATLDVGQTVIVKGGVVIAVEALEGTDAAIRRAHSLVQDGLVVVKTASIRQDRRFDLPVVGLTTIATLRDTGASCLAVEAASTLLLDRDELVASADAANLCLIGVEPPRSEP